MQICLEASSTHSLKIDVDPGELLNVSKDTFLENNPKFNMTFFLTSLMQRRKADL